MSQYIMFSSRATHDHKYLKGAQLMPCSHNVLQCDSVADVVLYLSKKPN